MSQRKNRMGWNWAKLAVTVNMVRSETVYKKPLVIGIMISTFSKGCSRYICLIEVRARVVAVEQPCRGMPCYLYCVYCAVKIHKPRTDQQWNGYQDSAPIVDQRSMCWQVPKHFDRTDALVLTNRPRSVWYRDFLLFNSVEGWYMAAKFNFHFALMLL